MEKIIDLHIHSKYSRACSKELELSKIAKACETKGIDIVATGDFTHPAWFSHIKESLIEDGIGLYRLKNESSTTRFILSTEISCIYTNTDKTRRLHLLILATNIEAVEKLNKALEEKGGNLKSDGRPIMGLSAKQILQLLLELDKRFMLIPAHAWTPWFAVFGSKSGYDSLEECFEELTPEIRAIETGLSSDPPMNHLLSALDKIVLVSNSDAHSLDNLGREANVFNFENDNEITYQNLIDIIKSGDKKRFLYTIEFYPEEGKYHFDGHMNCGVCFTPQETKEHNFLCPKCHKQLTVGVLHRVDHLADRKENEIPAEKFIPHKYIVPLREIISGVFSVGVKSKKVNAECQSILKAVGTEFYTLLKAPKEVLIKSVTDKNIALSILNMRQGKVKVSPGFDGQFGKVNLLLSEELAKNKQGRLI